MSGTPPSWLMEALTETLTRRCECERLRLCAEDECERLRLRAEKAERWLAVVVHMCIALGSGAPAPPGVDGESHIRAMMTKAVQAGMGEEEAAYFQDIAVRWAISPEMYTTAFEGVTAAMAGRGPERPQPPTPSSPAE